jgi:hypothetical protein
MIKPSLVISALLLLSASVANAETTTPAAPGSQGAASVQKNIDADKSGGKADKGLTNAEEHITTEHGKAKDGKDEKKEAKKERKEDKKEAKKEHMEKAEHHEHKDRMERPAKPERPGK